MKILIVFNIVILIAASIAEYFGDLPMQNPDLFEGDIVGIEDTEVRNAISDEKRRWPNGVIYYSIDNALEAHETELEKVMKGYEKHTCLQFKKRNNEEDYVRIFKGEGCYSNVGRTGRAQPLSLGYGCYFPGTMAHELGHAIGFYHEHNRSDRDDYLNIFWINIMQNMKPQFKKLFPTENVLYDEFNYRSVMLYGETAFSKNPIKFKTMVAKKEGVTLRDVHDKQGPDESDYYRINKMYNCKEFLKAE
ncbi:astacin-like metalloprotease toxin 5 [Centruroides vittatus]|uniref:astacin-like metalloprotease toxin 5 n=1 Tax=Centruroides vittatus TaxID=120091 RepID=UPI0035106F6C